MIKMIVLDVDGVLTGNLHGINFPYPNEKVIEALKQIRKKGTPVVLCTGKYFPAIEPIILKAQLNNPHITDGGALIIDPLDNKKSEVIYADKDIVSEIIKRFFENKLHIEAFTEAGLLVQKGTSKDYLIKRARINQRDSITVDSLMEETKKYDVIRLTAVAFNEDERKRADTVLKEFGGLIKAVWTLNPSTPNLQYCIISSPKATKIKSLSKIASQLNVSLENALGVGDTMGDWEFMKDCGYTATMKDAPQELKKLSQFVAPSVNDNGILEIFKYFLK